MKTRSERFKWNPFSLLGETPFGLRFKTEIDDLEFASKEDLEKIKAHPELSKLHQAMTAGVTKKFQGYSEEKKQLLKAVESLQAQVGELDGGLQEWENWFITNREALANLGKGEFEPDLRGKRVKGGEGEEGMYEKKFTQLVQAINQAGSQFEKKLTHMGKMLSLSMQLNELYRKNPTMDGEKILDVALKSGETDLARAYGEVYHDEILSKEVEAKLTPRLEEELQKRLTKVETGSGATPLKFEIAKETPKTWTDAGAEFLKERAAEEAKPPAKTP